MRASVIIAAHNARHTLSRAVNSAVLQTLTDIEVIVVDDGSTDGTADLVGELASRDRRVKLIRHESAKGVSSARNSAIRDASGEWLVILDADDWIAGDRLEVMIGQGEERRLDVVIDNLIRVDARTGRELGEAFPSEWMTVQDPVSMSFLIERDMPYCQTNGFGYCKPVFRREAFWATTGGYQANIRCAEDVLALQTMLFHGCRVGVIDAALYYYSVSPGSLSNRSGANVHTSRVNASLTSMARRYSPGMVQLLRARQVMIDYDAMTKAFRQKKPLEAVYFFFKTPKTVLIEQWARSLAQTLQFDTHIADPRSPAWLTRKGRDCLSHLGHHGLD